MAILKNNLYQLDVLKVAQQFRQEKQLKDKTFFISGATGMIGSFYIDVLMALNSEYQFNVNIVALGRSEAKAKKRFDSYWKSAYFSFICLDITNPIHPDYGKIDYVLHLASTTHPRDYASIPIETITSNILGTKSLLDIASQYGSRFMLASTVEIYGENRNDVELFEESYCGYINSNTLRAGYPESKRAAEALCQAYKVQKNVDVIIPRLSRVYGPTMLKTDSKALSQFIRNAVDREDIVLKSEGTQYFSYAYVADAVSALLYLFINGNSGEAYNIATDNIRLKDLAKQLANIAQTNVIFDLPDEQEKAGFSKATKALLDTSKIKKLGWQPEFTIATGLEHTVEILKSAD